MKYSDETYGQMKSRLMTAKSFTAFQQVVEALKKDFKEQGFKMTSDINALAVYNARLHPKFSKPNEPPPPPPVLNESMRPVYRDWFLDKNIKWLKEQTRVDEEKVANPHIVPKHDSYIRELEPPKNNDIKHKKNTDDPDFSNISQLHVIQWIFDNIGRTSVSRKDAPSPGAWYYLETLRDNESLLSDFYKNVYPKTFPSGSAREEQIRKMADGGRRLIRIIDDVINAAELPPARSKRLAEELVVPQEDNIFG